MRRDIGKSIADEEEENDINLTPMLDVVFIMLIFFIVTASFVKESGLDVNKPPDSDIQQNEEDKNILISINANDDVYIARRLIDKRAIRANIERLHAENPEGTVVIQAHVASSNNALVEVMDASRRAGVYNVSIAQAIGGQ
ncbi:MAG: biopolymer transporter ExbD [Pseudomonadota bacterium]